MPTTLRYCTSPDVVVGLFSRSKQQIVGNSTMNLQKFDDGWKIIASHTSIAE